MAVPRGLPSVCPAAAVNNTALPPGGSEPRHLGFVNGGHVGFALANALDTLQKSTIESSIRHRFGEKFQYALLPAVLLLLIELLLGERARPRRREEAA